MRAAIAVATMVVPLLAGCLSGVGSDTEDVAPQWNGHPLDAPLTSWLHDLVEPVDIEDLTLLREQYRTPVPGPDGVDVEIDTWVIRPESDEQLPLVIQITPYFRGGEPASLGRYGNELLSRGYAIAVSSVRGTGASGGCFTIGGPEEAKDSAAVIEHLAAQPWTTGKVGLIGGSYAGTTPQDVWVEAPPSLTTIVPFAGISDLYKYNFVNAVPVSIQGLAFNTYYWYYVGLGGTLDLGYTDSITRDQESPKRLPDAPVRDFIENDPENFPDALAGEACTDQVDVQQGGITSTIDNNKDEYWQVRDFAAEYWSDDREVERASVFYIHGLQDWNVMDHNLEGWLDVYEDSGVPYKLMLGQWGHAWPAKTGTDPEDLCYYDNETGRGEACRADWWDQVLGAWFDHHLKGIDTGIMDAPPVQVQNDDGVWRHEQSWPPKDAEVVTFHLTQEGLSTETAGEGSASYEVGAGGQSSSAGPRLVFRSEPLQEDLAVSGMPRLTATVSASQHRASLIFSLGEEDEDGSIRWINHGALSLNHAQDLTDGAPSVADVPIEVGLNLFPQDDVLHAGNRMILSFGPNTAGGPGPALIPTNDAGTITIDLSSASLHLPVDRSVFPEDPQPFVGPRPAEEGPGST